MDADLSAMAEQLGTTKSEVIRRALVLFKHALKAEKVTLSSGTEQQSVLLR